MVVLAQLHLPAAEAAVVQLPLPAAVEVVAQLPLPAAAVAAVVQLPLPAAAVAAVVQLPLPAAAAAAVVVLPAVAAGVPGQPQAQEVGQRVQAEAAALGSPQAQWGTGHGGAGEDAGGQNQEGAQLQRQRLLEEQVQLALAVRRSPRELHPMCGLPTHLSCHHHTHPRFDLHSNTCLLLSVGMPAMQKSTTC